MSNTRFQGIGGNSSQFLLHVRSLRTLLLRIEGVLRLMKKDIFFYFLAHWPYWFVQGGDHSSDAVSPLLSKQGYWGSLNSVWQAQQFFTMGVNMFKNLSRYLHYIHLSEIQQTYSPRRHKNKQIQYEDVASRINTISSPQFVHLPGNANVSLLVSVMLPSRGASPNKRTLIVCSWNSLQKGEVVWFNHVHFQYCSLIMDLIQLMI